MRWSAVPGWGRRSGRARSSRGRSRSPRRSCSTPTRSISSRAIVLLAAAVAARAAPTLATPHPAKPPACCASTADVQEDRLAAAQALATKLNAPVVVKGAGSVLAHADGSCDINASGNPACRPREPATCWRIRRRIPRAGHRREDGAAFRRVPARRRRRCAALPQGAGRSASRPRAPAGGSRLLNSRVRESAPSRPSSSATPARDARPPRPSARTSGAARSRSYRRAPARKLGRHRHRSSRFAA